CSRRTSSTRFSIRCAWPAPSAPVRHAWLRVTRRRLDRADVPTSGGPICTRVAERGSVFAERPEPEGRLEPAALDQRGFRGVRIVASGRIHRREHVRHSRTCCVRGARSAARPGVRLDLPCVSRYLPRQTHSLGRAPSTRPLIERLSGFGMTGFHRARRTVYAALTPVFVLGITACAGFP